MTTTLTEIADDVFVHESDCIQSNSVVVQCDAGVLVIDPGLTVSELSELAAACRGLGQPVVAGFATHAHWDHVLWHPDLGDAPRYGTARAAAEMADLFAHDDWRDQIAEGLPPEIAHDVPMELLGLITGLPAGASTIPWDGTRVRLLEHGGHAAGHAALVIEQSRVLVAGDMLSDVLVPMLTTQSVDPIGHYLAGLTVLESAVGSVDVLVPGHGSIARGTDIQARIDRDRAYVVALRDGAPIADPRVDAPRAGWEWVAGIHEWQAAALAG